MKVPKFLLFNFFTKETLYGFNSMTIFGRRLNSMSTDFSFILTISFPFFALLFIPAIFEIPDIGVGMDTFTLIFLIPYSIVEFLLLNKDIFSARSVAKRQYGYQIVSLKTNEPASELQCVIRNSTGVIWPVEVLVTMFSPTRRLGDLLAGTKLIDKEKEDPEQIMDEINREWKIQDKWKVIWTTILITIIFDLFSLVPILLN